MLAHWCITPPTRLIFDAMERLQCHAPDHPERPFAIHDTTSVDELPTVEITSSKHLSVTRLSEFIRFARLDLVSKTTVHVLRQRQMHH